MRKPRETYQQKIDSFKNISATELSESFKNYKKHNRTNLSWQSYNILWDELKDEYYKVRTVLNECGLGNRQSRRRVLSRA